MFFLLFDFVIFLYIKNIYKHKMHTLVHPLILTPFFRYLDYFPYFAK